MGLIVRAESAFLHIFVTVFSTVWFQILCSVDQRFFSDVVDCAVWLCMISSASKQWLLWGFSDSAAAQFISDAMCIVSDIRISAAGRCNAFCDVPGDKVNSVVAEFHAFVDSSVTVLVQFCVRLFGGRGCNFYSLWFRVLKKIVQPNFYVFYNYLINLFWSLLT